MTMINTPDGIAHFHMCQHIAALKIEIETGMQMSRGSVMNSAREKYGIQKRTKKGVLAELLKIYKSTYGWEYGSKRDG